jgi:hypothetical protein
MMAQGYQYQPLDMTLGQIRVVQLLPGNDEPLRIKLTICPLTEIAFNALSYTWGSSDMRHTIECEGKTIRIVPNLHRFLQFLRQSGHVEPLWIDYICIDTNNNEEKAHTLPRMPIIYRTAQQTLCWIGDEDLTPLQDFMSKTLEMADYRGAVIQCLSEVDILHSTYRIMEHDLEVFGKEAGMLDSSIWHKLDAFLNRKYFTRFVKYCFRFFTDLLSSRLWIIQDIVCSRNPVIFGLKRDTPWSELAKTLLIWLFFSPKSEPRSPAAMFVLLCETMRCKNFGSDNRRLTLPELLLAVRSTPAVCSFNTDYVHIVSNIASDMLIHDTPELDDQLARGPGYAYVSWKLNSSSGQPLSLSLTDDIQPHQGSWSANWEARTKRFLLNHPASSFLASKGLRAEQNSTEEMYCIERPEGQRMRCKGIIVDAVRKTSDYLPARRHCDHYDVNDHCLFFFNWYEFATEHSNLEENDLLLDYADTIQARGCGHLWEDAEITPQNRIRKARAFLDFLSDEDADQADITNSIRLFHAACFPSHDRRFAITRRGRLCLVPKNTQNSDLVCIPHNSRVPYVFRPRMEGDGFINIGETFVHGIMHGQMSEPKDCEEMEFVLH